MKRSVASILFTAALVVLFGSAAYAITFGKEITNPSGKYSSIVSIWVSEDADSEPEFICTGTLIEPRIVLTAAHCVLEKTYLYYIKYGNDLLDDETELLEVSATWRDPKYSEKQLVNDVGLLLLTEEIDNAATSPLSSEASIKKLLKTKGVKLEIAGWGVNQNRVLATYLRKLSVIDLSSLMAKYRKGWRNDVWMAVGTYNSKEKVFAGACSGDSGGPLFATARSKTLLVGVTSWGAKNCELQVPSVYARLSYYANRVKTEGINTLLVNEKKKNIALPQVIVEPSIVGTPKVGSTITCNSGKWSENTSSIDISWSGTGVPSGFNGATLILKDASEDSTLFCSITAKSQNGTLTREVSIEVLSKPKIIQATVIINMPKSDSYQDSNIVSCTPGKFSGIDTISTNWWFQSTGKPDVKLPQTSTNTFDLTKQLILNNPNSTLVCQVIADGPGGSTQSIARVDIIPWPKPSIKSGTISIGGISSSEPTSIGQVLTCGGVVWSKNVEEIKYRFIIKKWPENIVVGNSSSLTLTKDLIEKFTSQEIYCEISGINISGVTVSDSSAYIIKKPLERPSFIINSGATQIVTVNTPISKTSVSNSGGPATGYTITPNLPAGLGFNSGNGQIDGIPTQLQPLKEYFITSSGLGGISDVVIFTLTVVAPKPIISEMSKTTAAYPGGRLFTQFKVSANKVVVEVRTATATLLKNNTEISTTFCNPHTSLPLAALGFYECNIKLPTDVKKTNPSVYSIRYEVLDINSYGAQATDVLDTITDHPVTTGGASITKTGDPDKIAAGDVFTCNIGNWPYLNEAQFPVTCEWAGTGPRVRALTYTITSAMAELPSFGFLVYLRAAASPQNDGAWTYFYFENSSGMLEQHRGGDFYGRTFTNSNTTATPTPTPTPSAEPLPFIPTSYDPLYHQWAAFPGDYVIVDRVGSHWDAAGNLNVKQGDEITFEWKQKGAMATGSLPTVTSSYTNYVGRADFDKAVFGTIMNCDPAILLSGDRLEGVWKSKCTFYAPIKTEWNMDFSVSFASLNSRWVGSGGGASWQRGTAADNSKLVVFDNLNFEASVRPTIVIYMDNFGRVLSRQNLSSSFNFSATDADDINYLTWQICAPTGECGPNNLTPRGALKGSISQGLFTSTLEQVPVLSLFIKGLGSPAGAWTLKLGAIDTTWTWGVKSVTINLP